MGKVCLIRAGKTDLYKVGYTSKTPDDRRSSLQTGNPFPLNVVASWNGSESDEHRLHDLLDPYRKEGEWFELTVSKLLHLLCQYDSLSDQTISSEGVKALPSVSKSNGKNVDQCSEVCRRLCEFDVLKGNPFVWSEREKMFWKLPFEAGEMYHGAKCFDYCVRRGYIQESSDPPGIYRVNPELGEEGFKFFWEFAVE